MKLNISKDYSLEAESLKKHIIALGSSGSGKTVLCKKIIEEAALKNIPSIIIDPQGDLASLALSQNKKYNEKVSIKIYSPGSKKGLPISVNPLKMPDSDLEEEELIPILTQISTSIVKLIGFDIQKDKGKDAQAYIYYILNHCYKEKILLNDFSDLLSVLKETRYDEEIINEKEHKNIMHKIRHLTIGEKNLFFNLGEKLDVENLFKSENKKTTVSVIYLNTLNSMEDKDFFVSNIAKEIYQWILKNPKDSVQGLFYIDEISSFIPAGTKQTLSKDILRLLYKQARKYGLGCIVSTQNPGDIDYKAFAQFGTWFIGRLTTNQDRDKIKDALKSIGGNDETLQSLASLKIGEFIVFSPDYGGIKKIKSDQLLSEHKTLTEADIQKITGNLKKNTDKRVEEKMENKITPNASKKYFKLNIEKEELSKIIDKNKKREYFLFGDKEHIDSVRLVLWPFYRLLTKKPEQRFFGLKEQIVEYLLYFNASSGDIFKFNSDKFKSYSVRELFKLNENELRIFKGVLQIDEKHTTTEIALKLDIPVQSAGIFLNKLHEKKLLSYDSENKVSKWFHLMDNTDILRIKKLASNQSEMDEKDLDGIKFPTNVNINDCINFTRIWFKCETVDSNTVYYPTYEVRLYSKAGKRTIYISGVTGETVKGFY